MGWFISFPMPSIQSTMRRRPPNPERDVLAALALSTKKAGFLKIEAVQEMPPFLINLVSPEDQWLFINSEGALTAGRNSPDQALFPYVTDDKLADLAKTTGSVTLVRKEATARGSAPSIWAPFQPNAGEREGIERTLYKRPEGNEIILEETNHKWALQFSCGWSFSPRYGFVRSVEMRNLGPVETSFQLLDGALNLVPHGLEHFFVNRFSNLSNAYKKSELLLPEGLGIYYLSSIPTDKAEPSESLKATVAWSLHYEPDHILLSDGQIEGWHRSGTVRDETDVRGRRGAYLLEKRVSLPAGESFLGWVVADLNQDAGRIEILRKELTNPDALLSRLAKDIASGNASIRQKLSSADGYQVTGDQPRCRRHLSNVLFNVMRGGIFHDHYGLPRDDFLRHLKRRNGLVYAQFRSELQRLPKEVERDALMKAIERRRDPDLSRLGLEYLPLTFSRRHGDPSRPWNTFSIDTRDSEGEPTLAYQGNWRDIFQNWEALAYSYPGFLSGMIFRFLNASTADGYNPYRLTKEGFEWEEMDPDEPWANIGYWGDHQIVYLLKFLELSEKFQPRALSGLLTDRRFVYADLPYRITGFDEIWANPHETIRFDHSANDATGKRMEEMGTDGKLLMGEDGRPLKVTLLEKLLVPLLSKLSNFVPEGGIWLTTQRPEWNDANNALAGNGLSVVSLGYIHRYLKFFIAFLGGESVPPTARVSGAVYAFFQSQYSALSTYAGLLADPLNDGDRYRVTRLLGEAGSIHRQSVYQNRLEGRGRDLAMASVVAFLKCAQAWVAHSLKANGREDGLFHSYNLLRRSRESIGIERLHQMLEGQVSILSSQFLSPKAAARLLDGLKRSKLFLPDKGSYLLYPDRELPQFLEKNRISERAWRNSPVIRHLLERGDERICYRDIRGNVRFNGDFRNVGDLNKALQRLKGGPLAPFSTQQMEEVAEVFEKTFSHHAFTGRSGAFFAYEGLGSIYWHMVSKLLLAIQETYQAAAGHAPAEVLEKLARHYYQTLEGLGLYDKPEDYGAFPSDAYSHTPKHSGAQQPGMTGQVKEDILVRWGELGIRIEDGCLSFRPLLLREDEFITEPGKLRFRGLDNHERSIDLEPGQLAFTFCQTPVVYTLDATDRMRIVFADGSVEELGALRLPREVSEALFARTGNIALIEVSISIPHPPPN